MAASKGGAQAEGSRGASLKLPGLLIPERSGISFIGAAALQRSQEGDGINVLLSWKQVAVTQCSRGTAELS